MVEISEEVYRNRRNMQNTNDIMRPNDRDKDQARHASTDMAIRRSRVEIGLVNHAQDITPSLASTNTGRGGLRHKMDSED